MWRILDNSNLTAAGYSSETARAEVVFKMVQMKISIVLQADTSTSAVDALRDLVHDPPAWVEMRLKLDLLCIATALDFGKTTLATKPQIADAEAAFADIDAGRHPLAKYISDWPVGKKSWRTSASD